MNRRRRIGVLALQGGFAAHAARLDMLGHDVTLVRTADDCAALDGLVLPGGESSVQLLLIERFALGPSIRALAAGGKPILATCAGLILLAKNVTSPAQASLGLLEVDVARNAYGRQRHSFEAIDDAGELPLVFIRAPRILRMGSGVHVLATHQGEPILVEEGNVVGATFHPELTLDPSVHRRVFGSNVDEIDGRKPTVGSPSSRL
jgi:5'-phosphate synthase pdxT subunit